MIVKSKNLDFVVRVENKDYKIRYINGTKNHYAISKCGDIISFRRRKTGKLLKPQKNNGGYYMVSMCKGGDRRSFLVSRLVAEVYIKNNDPLSCIYVNHKNGIKTDNRVENLEWCTCSHNIKHAFRIGLSTHKGDDHNNKKLNSHVVLSIRRFKAKYPSFDTNIIAEIVGVTKRHINSILSEETWIGRPAQALAEHFEGKGENNG